MILTLLEGDFDWTGWNSTPSPVNKVSKDPKVLWLHGLLSKWLLLNLLWQGLLLQIFGLNGEPATGHYHWLMVDHWFHIFFIHIGSMAKLFWILFRWSPFETHWLMILVGHSVICLGPKLEIFPVHSVFVGSGAQGITGLESATLLETNMAAIALENQCLEDDISFWDGLFSGANC